MHAKIDIIAHSLVFRSLREQGLSSYFIGEGFTKGLHQFFLALQLALAGVDRLALLVILVTDLLIVSSSCVKYIPQRVMVTREDKLWQLLATSYGKSLWRVMVSR